MRFHLITGLGGVLVLIAFIIAFGSGAPIHPSIPALPAQSTPASSLAVVPPATFPGLFFQASSSSAALPSVPTSASTTVAGSGTSTSAAVQPPLAPPKPPVAKVPTPSNASAQPAAAIASSSSVLEQNALALQLPTLRNALVNIICIPRDHSFKAISGSGVIIDPRGVILTVAHVGQYFLLKDYPTPDNVVCVIRSGSPARTKYLATPIYVSGTWIKDNSKIFTAATPTGTGENDFALLAITDSATTVPLPSTFPYVKLSLDDPQKNDLVVIGSYGAEFTASNEIKSSLFPTLVFGSVQERYTFGTNSVDLLSLGGSAAAQEGSSGGGVINSKGELIGLITTSTTNGGFLVRDLHAITPRHIRMSFNTDQGADLDVYLADHAIATLISNFTSAMGKLENVLVRAIVASS